MKQFMSSQLLAFLQTHTKWFPADLFLIQLSNGKLISATSGQQDINYAGTTFYTSKYGVWERGPITSEASFTPGQSEPMDLTVVASTSVLFPGLNASLAASIQAGLFDGAKVWVYALYMPTYGDTSLGHEIKFYGEIAPVSSFDPRGTCTFQCFDPAYRLSVSVPPNTFRPCCKNVFGDVNCGFNVSTVTVGCAVASGSTSSVINVVTPLPSTSPFPANFVEGIVRWGSSSANSGLGAKVKAQNSSTQIVLEAPTFIPPVVGDTFSLQANCNKTAGTGGCLTFNNLDSFTGTDFVPPPETAL